MKQLFALVLTVLIWFSIVPVAAAENTSLVPCKDSPAFLARMKQAPDGYYFDKPYEAYSEYLLCGEEGLPHLTLDRLSLAVDVAIPFSIFLYVAGFIGWSGRSYLIAARKDKSPEQKEIFIDMPMAIQSITKGLLWPLLAVQELLTGQLTVKEEEIPISPR
ncbi:MAG: Photosystem I reaction center subunit III [Coleofasciculaceae cyanobacterium]